MELRAVMTQIPNISVEALDQYDHRLMDPNAQKVGDKKRKDQFRKLIAGTVGVTPHLATRGQCLSIISHCVGSSSEVTGDAGLIVQVITQQCDSGCVVNLLRSAAKNVQRLNRAVQSNEILSGRSGIALFNLSSLCPLPTESPVPAVQEGGSYPESSIAL